MSVAIPITRLDYTASELRGFAGKCGDGAQVRRLLAIALVLDGRSRAEAAELNGMDRQTLSDWVHRYNVDGIDSLKSRHPPGAAPRLSEAQRAELRELVVAGSGSGERQGHPLALPGSTGGNRSPVLGASA